MKCTTCPTVTESIHSHHVIPVAYGGKKNGLRVNLCGNCHNLVHKYIENLDDIPPPELTRLVEVGRLAKAQFMAGNLEARDRRPTLLIPLTVDDTKLLRFLSIKFNTKS